VCVCVCICMYVCAAGPPTCGIPELLVGAMTKHQVEETSGERVENLKQCLTTFVVPHLIDPPSIAVKPKDIHKQRRKLLRELCAVCQKRRLQSQSRVDESERERERETSHAERDSATQQCTNRKRELQPGGGTFKVFLVVSEIFQEVIDILAFG
jgi:hypothetical protein